MNKVRKKYAALKKEHKACKYVRDYTNEYVRKALANLTGGSAADIERVTLSALKELNEKGVIKQIQPCVITFTAKII